MQSYGITLLDIVVIAVVVVSALFALMRGAVREVVSLASWVGAVILAFRLFPFLQELIRPVIAEPFIADAVAGIAAFLAPLLVLRLFGGFIANRVDQSPLGSMDKLVGLGLGAVRGVVVIAALYLVASWVWPPTNQPVWVTGARLYPQVREAAVLLERSLPERVRLDARAATEAAGRAGDEAGYGDASRKALEQILPATP